MLLALALFACSSEETGDTSDTGDTGGGLPQVDAPPLVINEVLASNDTSQADGAGEFDDWVEIYNNGDTIVSLDGFYLSDTEDEPTLFQFPAGQGIEVGGFLAVWCDNDIEQATATELHAPFKLNAKGDFVYLNYAEDNQVGVADSVYWEAQQTADVAAARVPDGSETWVNQAATFEASNGG